MSKDIFDQTNLGGIPMKNRLIRSATWEVFEKKMQAAFCEELKFLRWDRKILFG